MTMVSLCIINYVEFSICEQSDARTKRMCQKQAHPLYSLLLAGGNGKSNGLIAV